MKLKQVVDNAFKERELFEKTSAVLEVEVSGKVWIQIPAALIFSDNWQISFRAPKETEEILKELL